MAPPQTLHEQGINVTYTAIALLCQTFFFGVYAILMPFSAYFIIKRGQRSRANWLIWVALFMFLLSSAFWTASVANLFLRYQAYFIAPSPAFARKIDTFSTLANAIILSNYVLTDGVVVWRAWVLCRHDSGRVLYVPCAFLFLTSLSVVSTIVIRVILIVRTDHGLVSPQLSRAIDITQVANLAFTLLTNGSATGIISAKAWKYRKMMRRSIREAERNGTKVETIFALLVESGSIYCVSGITVLIATVVRLPHGTLGDIYTPVNVQIAGIYPTIVLVIVSMQLTMKETTFFGGTAAGDTQDLEFASPPERGQLGTGTAVRFESNQHTYRFRREDDQLELASDRVPRLKTLDAGEKFIADDLVVVGMRSRA
ncbi:hypothetical protein EXIGLDRAFT_783013 [Exidia glandulosa HHB12029]|uniref:Uncharacterized protein n=1 Tax=Exidia glandulosa HHB12029 TaxID=1314781 RepID=A0A166NB47_EXIGL|nr:hypothetical protein EXIGLDRAFT_783013 [Exidia glandulosa HHB12029]